MARSGCCKWLCDLLFELFVFIVALSVVVVVKVVVVVNVIIVVNVVVVVVTVLACC